MPICYIFDMTFNTLVRPSHRYSGREQYKNDQTTFQHLHFLKDEPPNSFPQCRHLVDPLYPRKLPTEDSKGLVPHQLVCTLLEYCGHDRGHFGLAYLPSLYHSHCATRGQLSFPGSNFQNFKHDYVMT